jgi:hypothetical protein
VQSTNVSTPTGKSVQAQTISPSGGSQASTSGTFTSETRTIPVKSTQGEVRLRYAPISPKPAIKQSR